jgi:acylphosphatase
MIRLRAVVKGTVQGVGYRYFAVRHAEALGITGYVRNVPGGDVEVVAEGEEYKINLFEKELRRGPSGAFVRDVISVRLPATGEFPDFRIAF